MKIINKKISLITKGFTDIIEITNKVLNKLNTSGIKEGTVIIICPGSTGALTTCKIKGHWTCPSKMDT